MNFIQQNKSVILIILINILGLTNVFSQKLTPENKNFSLVATIGNGLIFNIENNVNPLNTIYYAPTLRVLWKPNHLLNIGIESAYMTISKHDSDLVSSSFGNTILKARMNAIPVLLVFNMKILKIDLYAGIGLSNIISRLEAFQDKVIVHDWYFTYNLGVGYSYPLSKDFLIGFETKTYFFPRIQKITGGLMINISYSFLRW